MWAFQQAGISLPHSSQAQASGGQAVSLSDLQPGDVLTYYSDASHTGIYVGDGMVIHSSTYGVPGAGGADECRRADFRRPSLLDRPGARRRSMVVPILLAWVLVVELITAAAVPLHAERDRAIRHAQVVTPAHAHTSSVKQQFHAGDPPRPVARVERPGRRAPDVANPGRHRGRDPGGGGFLGHRMDARNLNGGRRHGRRVSRRRRSGPRNAVGRHRGGDGRRPTLIRFGVWRSRRADRVLRQGRPGMSEKALRIVLDARAFPLCGTRRHRDGRTPLADRRGS